MRRRDILGGAAVVATGATSSFPQPAIAQGIRRLKMVTDWPAGSPGLQSSATRLAQRIGTASGGRINIEVFPAGVFVGAFETFDAVGAGVADMYHSNEYYWEKKSLAFSFFAAVPFGLTANELFAWVQYGGGQDLWDELSGKFNIKPLLCCNTGTQMGGWFTREVPSPEAFRGLRYRMPGLGGEVLRRLGAIVVNVRGGEIVGTIKSGAIDGSEWVGPWLDMALGLHKVASITTILGSTSRAPAKRSASTSVCGKASTRASDRSSKTPLRPNTPTPSRNSIQTMHWVCASCATKAPSRFSTSATRC